jgi:hypothetical protein
MVERRVHVFDFVSLHLCHHGTRSLIGEWKSTQMIIQVPLDLPLGFGQEPE